MSDFGPPIFVSAEALDLRRSFDGLAGGVKDVLRQDPLSGALFLFFNRAADRVKVLCQWIESHLTWPPASLYTS